MLRSALWGWKNNIRWATRVSANIEAGFGVFMIIFGVFHVLSGNFVGGMWWFLIGMFIQGAAKASYQQLVTRRALQGEPVERFMKREIFTVQPSVSLQELIENYVYRHHFKMFPVVEDSNKLFGCVATQQVKETPRDEWSKKKVRDVATRCSDKNTIDPKADAVEALSRMKRNGTSRLMVTEGNKIVGTLALKDLLDFLALKVELHEV